MQTLSTIHAIICVNHFKLKNLYAWERVPLNQFELDVPSVEGEFMGMLRL